MPINEILQSDWCCDYSCSDTSAIHECHQILFDAGAYTESDNALRRNSGLATRDYIMPTLQYCHGNMYMKPPCTSCGVILTDYHGYYPQPLHYTSEMAGSSYAPFPYWQHEHQVTSWHYLILP